MYKFMQIYGNCAAVHYLGPERIKGPVDNVITKGIDCLKILVDGDYADYIATREPKIVDRKANFEGDSNLAYIYPIVNVVHENPKTEKYINEVKVRQANFKEFLEKVYTDKNYYFVYTLNDYEVDNQKHKLKNKKSFITNIEYLKEKQLLNKVIFVGNRPGKTGYAWWDFWTEDLIPIIKAYNLKYTEVTEMSYGKSIEQDKILMSRFQQQAKLVIEYGTERKYLETKSSNKQKVFTKKQQSYLGTGYFGL